MHFQTLKKSIQWFLLFYRLSKPRRQALAAENCTPGQRFLAISQGFHQGHYWPVRDQSRGNTGSSESCCSRCRASVSALVRRCYKHRKGESSAVWTISSGWSRMAVLSWWWIWCTVSNRVPNMLTGELPKSKNSLAESSSSPPPQRWGSAPFGPSQSFWAGCCTWSRGRELLWIRAQKGILNVAATHHWLGSALASFSWMRTVELLLLGKQYTNGQKFDCAWPDTCHYALSKGNEAQSFAWSRLIHTCHSHSRSSGEGINPADSFKRSSTRLCHQLLSSLLMIWR